MNKILLLLAVSIMLFSCGGGNNNEVSDSNSDSKETTNLNEMKTNNLDLSEIDKIVEEIDNSKDNLKTANGIATVEGGYGDFNAYYYNEENVCLLVFEPGGVTEYYYFTKDAKLCFAKTGEYHYQPWRYEENRYYISGGKIFDAYKCIRENDISDPCNAKKLEDKQLISDFENKIPSQIKNLTKSITDWPKLEEALIEISKNK